MRAATFLSRTHSNNGNSYNKGNSSKDKRSDHSIEDMSNGKKNLNNGIFLPRTNDNAEDHRQHITFLGKAGGASFEGGGGGGGLCVSST
jgi:hypothetical protein